MRDATGEMDFYKNHIYEKPYTDSCVVKKKCILKLDREVDN